MIKLENYKIIKKIASGGMGDVYLAEHTVLENKVAIKSLHSNLVNDESFRKRFRTEAKTQSRLSHPNIVKLIDFQERSDGLFLIMEYVKGKQLNDYIKNVSGPIPETELIPLFKKVLSAIKYAHSKKLVHRDIKPSNIMVCPGGDIKVIDFGIAKSGDEDTGLTKTGIQVGTVSYMSPEQVNAEKLDILTDIYSLGVTLYQMTVGKAPYIGVTNTFKIQLKIVSDPLPNPKQIYPGSTERLIKIINKATQKKKSDRYQSCDEFIKSFEEKPKKKILKKTKELKPQKSLTKQPKKPSIFKNKKVRLSIYAIIILLFAGFVLIPLIPKIEDKWDKYQIEINNKRIAKEAAAETRRINIEKAKRLEAIRLKEDAAVKARAAAKAKAEREEAEAEAEKLRIANLSAEAAAAEARALAKAKAEREAAAAKAKAKREAAIARAAAKAKAEKAAAEAEIIRLDSLKKGKPITLPNGDIYTGDWIRGERTGKGILKLKNGEIYQGDFVKGVRTGKGTLKMLNGNIYSGSFKNNEYNGSGIIRFPDGFRIEANWEKGKYNGVVTQIDSQGETLISNWKNGTELLPFIIVSGIIRDNKGTPLPGATVTIEETNKKVSANLNGEYSIRIKQENTLIVSYKGLKSKTRKIQKGQTIFSTTLTK
jgi:serine/threonine protein kinase